MAVRIFLTLQTLLWLPYGVFCFFQPAFLAEAAGVEFGSLTGNIEIRAMYGGLQAALGAFTLAGILREPLRRPALTAVAFLVAGLATARLGGVALEGDLSAYTGGALVFEIATVAIAVFFLRRSDAFAPAVT